MEKRDARTLKIATQQELRYQVVRLRKKGIKNQEVASIVGLSQATTSGIWSKYQTGGMKAIIIKRRGRKKGEKKTLSPQQESQIIPRLIDTTPEQLKFPYALWTRESVQKLLEHAFGTRMPLSTVGMYLQRWAFTSQVPIKRAYERNDAAVQQWLQEEYPVIGKQSQEANGEIQWADETACVSLPSRIKGYAPKGKTPVMNHPAKRFKINMISSITNRGKLHFMLYEQNMDAELFIQFLERLIAGSTKKIFLILDNLRVHHAKIVKAWAKKHQEDIALFYLPAYSPDLNPDEYLNNDFKRNVNSRHIPKNKEELTSNTKNFMTMLSENPQRIANYFKHPKIAYAA